MLRTLRPNEKLTQIIDKIGNKKLISIEINPHKPIDFHLLQRINPSFCTVKWITKLQDFSQPKLLNSVIMSKELVTKGYTVLVQIPDSLCADQNTKLILEIFKENGIRNLYIKRDGGSPIKTNAEYTGSKNLIRFIRDEFGEYFDIIIVGFPDEHCYGSIENQMLLLRQKVTAGVNVILTRGSVYPEKYFMFKKICVQYAIDVPIIFGICMFSSWKQLHGTKKQFSGIDHQEIVDVKDPLEGKWQLQMIENGRAWSKHMFENLLKNELTVGVHIFSRVSLELVRNILTEIKAHNHQANMRKLIKNI
ncbi:hypothetical protein WA026_010574 [Henosepilachna vigintioctopunctata]|uniref:Methylenetetrahydrofolate reductase (NAD(P)H) n=1 Tax=Henosepilachna vigintioctopunctata TaxID=420089 RepID=A0AAW1VDJ2_9CUCU